MEIKRRAVVNRPKTVDNTGRHRCVITGCNPKLNSAEEAAQHKQETGHRTAKWPVMSAEGKRLAKERNRNGYYDKYNRHATE